MPENESSDDEIDLVEELAGLKIEMMNQVECEPDWIIGKGDYSIKCAYCIYYPSQDNRSTCRLCLKQTCASCLKATNQNWRQEIMVEPENRIFSIRVRNLESRINNLEVDIEEIKHWLAKDPNFAKQKPNSVENMEQI